VRHPAEAKLGDQMLEAGEPLQLAQLLEAVVRGADHLDLHVEVCRFLVVLPPRMM